MTVIRCTAKLRKLLDLSSPAEPPTDQSGFPGSWFANLLWIDRRKCILFTHSSTLFSVVALGVRAVDLKEFGRFFTTVLVENLQLEGFSAMTVAAMERECEDIILAKTNSHSVLGSMSDLAINLKTHIRMSGGVIEALPAALNYQLNRIPMGAIAYRYGIDEFRELAARHFGYSGH